MTVINVKTFGGLVPKVDPKLLPDTCAVEAINTDLRGGGIKPMYAPLMKRTTTYTHPERTHGVEQIRSPGVTLRNGAATTNFLKILPGTNPRAIKAGDLLIYAVFLPGSPAPVAGQGCIQLHFSGGSTLKATAVDQNGINAVTGNLGPQCGGNNWYLRSIVLGGDVDLAGNPLNGQTITQVDLFQNYSNQPYPSATYGFVVMGQSIVGDAFALYDPMMGDRVDLTAGSFPASFLVSEAGIDEDDNALLVVAESATGDDYNARSLVQIPASGQFKGRCIFQTSDPFSLYQGRTYGLHGRDLIYFGATSVFPSSDYKLAPPPGNKWPAYPVEGWLYVPAPTVALGAPAIVGGVATNVTRAYVYTIVNEYGMESAPSPPVSATGHPDGSWNFTAIPTWGGTDQFPSGIAGKKKHKTRIYRTPVGQSFYRLVAQIDDNVTALNDAVTDANLGAELATTSYKEVDSKMYGFSAWGSGLTACASDAFEVAFSDPNQPHAYPLENRYAVTQKVIACKDFGDRLFALTEGPPIAFYGGSGVSPDKIQWNEINNGEACVGARAILKTPRGVIYCARTGWGKLDYSGYQNLSAAYFNEEQFPVVATKETIAMYDRRRLIWMFRGATTGYALDLDAQERGLVKFQVPDSIYGMSYYDPRGNRWIAYYNSGVMKIGLLFGDTTTKMKWTWRSKLFKSPKPVTMAVAKVTSDEYGGFSTEMKKRNLWFVGAPNATAWVTATNYAVDAFVTNGGNTYRCLVAHASGVFATDLGAGKWVLNNAAYTIDTSGLTQGESWLYLKVWAHADDTAKITLVYDDFIADGQPVVLKAGYLSDCWQFEIRGNISVTDAALATSEVELNAQGE